MKILLDHCVPRPLRQSLIMHGVRTTAEMGWEELQNGKLLAAAALQFDVFLTVDKNLKSQQNLGTLPIAVLVLLARSNKLTDLEPLVPMTLAALSTIQSGQLIEVDASG